MTMRSITLSLASGLLLTLATGCANTSQPPPSGAPDTKQQDHAHPDAGAGDAGSDHK